MFGQHPIVGHFEFLAHPLSNHYKFRYRLSSTIYQHAPSVVKILLCPWLCRKGRELAVCHLHGRGLIVSCGFQRKWRRVESDPKSDPVTSPRTCQL